MKSFSYLCTTRIMLDEDVKKGLESVIALIGGKKAFVITDPGIAKLDSFAELKKNIELAGLEADYYTEVMPNPLDTSIRDCAEALKKSDADFVIGFGGGSTIDTAKSAAIVKTNGGDISDYYGVGKVKVPAMPMVGIPTTAGAGAEVSEFIALTDTKLNRKAQIASVYAAPTAALLCPSLLAGTPKPITTTAGIDAIGHAIESYINNFANPISEAISLQAFTLLTRNIRRFVENTADVEAAAAMTIGATMACTAAGRVGTGNCHNIARSVQGTYHMNHGAAIGVALPYTLDFVIDVVTEKLAKAAAAMGIDTTGMTERKAAEACVVGLQELRADLGLPGSYKELGVEKEKFDEMIQNSMIFGSSGSDKDTAPIKATYEQFEKMYNDAYEGVKITY